MNSPYNQTRKYIQNKRINTEISTTEYIIKWIRGLIEIKWKSKILPTINLRIYFI